MHTKIFQKYGAAKTGAAAMLLAAMVALSGGAAAATLADCAGGVTLDAPGSVKCAGQPLLSSCSGEIVIDSTGTVKCVAAPPTAAPTCTLAASTSFVPGSTHVLTASCAPTPVSYVWSYAGCSAASKTCNVAPTVTTDYTAAGKNSAGVAGNTATVRVTVGASAPPPPPPPPVTGKPVCTLGASSGFQVGKLLVQASCNPAATSYTWVNTGFASTVSSGYLDTPITTTTYYVTGHNASGSSDQASATHEVLAVVPTCTLTAAPPLIAPNGESILTASCNPAATSYTWTGGTCAVITTNSCTVTLAAGSQNYTVAGSNATGHGNTAGASVTVAPPTCTLTAAPPLIAPDGTSVLTASCSPAATDGYTWTGTGCVGELTNTCTVTLATASESYTVAGINGAGTGAPSPAATVTVSKPSCTLTAAPPSVAPGESSTLTASCTATPTSYAWDGSCAGSTTSCTVTPGATATYRMTATNLEGTSNPAEATVAVVVPGICTLDHRNIPFNWETDRGRNINEPLSRGQSLSFEFTTPGANAAGPLVKEQGNSSVGVPAWTFINISASQCDFTYPTLDISWNGCGQHGNVVALKYKVENVDSHTFGYCSLRPNTTYYINIRNEDIYAPGVDTCEAGATCGFLFNMTGSLTD